MTSQTPINATGAAFTANAQAARDESDPGSQAGAGSTDAIGAAAREQLRQFVARIERLEEEKAGLAADIKEVYGEAKSFGYDTTALRKVIAIRKQDRTEREEMEALLELYLGAVGE